MKKFHWLTPLLWGIYPVAALLAANIDELRWTDGLRGLAAGALLAAGLYALLRLRLPPEKAAVTASLTLLLFFTYGHVYNALKDYGLLALARHRLLGPLWVILLAASLWAVLRKARDLTAIRQALTAIAAVGLAFPLYQIAAYEVRASRAAELPSPGGLVAPANPPDIYYLIFDAYARDDSLSQTYGVDIADFLAGLEARGFYVARCASSNYAQTRMSLASSLNMSYLHNLLPDEVIASGDQTALQAYIKDSAVRAELEAIGYQTIAFETGFSWTEWRDADLFLAPEAQGSGLNHFETLLVETSALRLLTDARNLPAFLVPDTRYKEEIHRQRVLFVLEELETMPARPGPKFVFGHIVSPHPPYVFNADGSEAPPDPDPASAYAEQVRYLNTRILALVDALLANSATLPIIFIQGDHGAILADRQERMQILSAYYIPGAAPDAFYPELSPVNSFRLAFNAAFGGALPLLPDASYFSTYAAPYDYEPVQDARPGCAP